MGECLIDLLPLPRKGPNDEFRAYPAGSPLNIAVGVARLGQPSAFASKIGNDYFGRRLRAYIEQNNIDTRYLTTAEAHSTLAFVAMEAGQATFDFYGEGTADALMTPDDVPDTLFTDTAILQIGSVSLLRGTTPETVLKTFERMKGQALLSLDPNIRPSLVNDEAGYRALLQKLIGLTDLLKLSDADLAWLTPNLSIETALQQLARQVPALVVITRGAEGAIAMRKGGIPLQLPGFKVDVTDTIGAGDTFCAGLLTYLADQQILTHEALAGISDEEQHNMLRFAAAAAALNCLREGADPPARSEVEQFLAQHSAQ
ncbi:carbohydrate kinase family protein [Dictyobacter kobayashii]|uniref:Carbohydrate kinase n=1 Tax=Dictyobacter kobayashii TaxID=2014872 RepID=A0A402AY16_9CHLR|nr:carbohydrate kinase [Dictyobacter kobayashii]GCE23967.1 carbohydrate kinase [Dictyobacter kobayashii]